MYEITKNVKKRRLEKKLKKILFLYIFPLLFFIVMFVLLFNSKMFQIKEIKIKDNNLVFVYKKEVLKAAENYLDEYYLSILSKRNYIFFSNDDFEKEIISRFPDIKKIKVVSNNNILIINIIEEKPEFIYCLNEKKEKCFFMNRMSKIFADYKESLNVEKKYFYFYSLKEQKKGSYFFKQPEDLENILELIEKIKINFGLVVEGIHKEDKLFYKLILKDGEQILIDYDFNVQETIHKIKKIVHLDDLKIKNGKFIKKIDYINLFLKKRVAYCLKEDVCEGAY